MPSSAMATKPCLRNAIDEGQVITLEVRASWCTSCQFMFNAALSPTAFDHLPIREVMEMFPCLRTGVDNP